MFGTIRSIRDTGFLCAALFGFYFVAVDLVDANGFRAMATVGLVLLAALFVVGLWTSSPITAFVVTGNVVFLWAIAVINEPSLGKELDPSDPFRTYFYVMTPPLALGLGILSRSWLMHRRQPTVPETQE